MFDKVLRKPQSLRQAGQSTVQVPPRTQTQRRELTLEKHAPRIPYEITKVKGQKRVVIKRGQIPKSAKWIYWPKNHAYYWNNLSELDELITKEYLGHPEKNKLNMKLVFDVDYCEPFNERMEIIRSPIVERALINQSMDDFSDVVALTGFELTMKHVAVMAAVALLFLPV